MSAVSELDFPSLSVAYVRILVDVLVDRRLDARAIFAGLPRVEELVSQSDGRISTLHMLHLIGRALELSGDPTVGYDYGRRLRPTTHGFLGYAVLSSESVREAAEAAVRYARIRSRHVRFALVEREDDALLVAEETLLVRMPHLRRPIHEALAIGAVQGLALMLGRETTELHGVEIWFDRAEPEYYRACADRLPTMRFETGMLAMRVPRHLLDARPVLADPVASKEALAQCEREFAALPIDESDFVDHVRALLANAGVDEMPTLDAAAKQLAVSPRTLKRRLHGGGTTFLALVTERRERHARERLAQTSVPIATIASSLGYDPANFTRAFTRWTGITPSEFRERATRTERERS